MIQYDKGATLKKKLKAICDIQLGYSFRFRLEPSPAGNIAIIQMKDLSDDHCVNSDNLVRIEFQGMKEQHFVRQGDLIFRSRGVDNNTAILNEALECTLVSAPMFRLRISTPTLILPEYLNWYISQREAQHYFAQRIEGSNQKMINRRVLENLEICIPSIEKQNQIIELDRLMEQEQNLMKNIAFKRKQYWNEFLLKMAQGDSNNEQN